MSEIVFAIDPSINKCGWCVMSKDYKVLEYGLIKSTNKLIWYRKAYEITNKLYAKTSIDENIITNIILEIPEYWSGGTGLAAREGGSINKLMFICGSIYDRAICWSRNIEIVTPIKWKGTLSKEIVAKRLKEKFGKRIAKAEDHNVMDAIALAYSYFNNWKIL